MRFDEILAMIGGTIPPIVESPTPGGIDPKLSGMPTTTPGIKRDSSSIPYFTDTLTDNINTGTYNIIAIVAGIYCVLSLLLYQSIKMFNYSDETDPNKKKPDHSFIYSQLIIIFLTLYIISDESRKMDVYKLLSNDK